MEVIAYGMEDVKNYRGMKTELPDGKDEANGTDQELPHTTSHPAGPRKYTNYQILSFIFACILIVAGTFVLVNRESIIERNNKLDAHLLIWLFYLLAFVFLTANYLFCQTSEDKLVLPGGSLKYSDFLKSRISALERKLDSLSASSPNGDNPKRDVNLQYNIYHTKEHHNHLPGEKLKTEPGIAASGEGEAIIFRHSQNISEVNRISNVNLLIGILTTGLVIFILWDALASSRMTPVPGETLSAWSETKLFMYQFWPRLALCVLIELSSLFFLRMYRRCYYDRKYYSNEMTNIELKLLALKHAREVDNQELTSLVITEIAKTDRNHIIRRGETTLELEREKIGESMMEKFLACFENCMKTMSGKS